MPARHRIIVHSIALLLFALPSSALGQAMSVLALLPTDGRQLQVGAEQSGALSASDHLSTNDSFLEAWALLGQAGQSVTIDLISDEFDAMLYVVGPGLGETLSDDDGGGGCNSRLSVTFLESGTFHVVASSLGARETGTYTLRVSDRPSEAPTYACGDVDPAVLAALPVDGRSLEMGGQATGQLGAFSPTVLDGRPAEAWVLDARAGEAYSIVMESAAFDSYLYVSGPGLDGVLSDDDSGGDLNAQIDLRAAVDGPVLVVASSITSGASGSYTLRVGEPLDLAALPTFGRTLDLGQSVDGVLDTTAPIVADGRRGLAWELQLNAGQRLAVELHSDDFDAYLYVAGPGLTEPLSDDDGAGDLNSRVSFTAPESGSYRVIVSGLTADATGAFTLHVNPM